MAEASVKPSVAPVQSAPSVPLMPKTVQPVVEAAPEKKNVFSSMFSAKKEAPLASEKKSKVGTSVLKASFAVLILTAGFFYSQNSKSFTLFGANAAQKNVLAAAEVKSIDAGINVEKYLNAVYQLEKFSGTADEYFYNLEQSQSAYVSENKKIEYKVSVLKLKPELDALVASIKEKFATPMDEEQKTQTVMQINEEIDALKKKSGQVDDQALLSDIQDLESARKILASEAFRAAVNAADAENTGDENLQKLLTEYNKINRSVTALIANIRQSRLLWSEYLAEIEAVTKKIDPLFGTEFDLNLSLESVGFNKEDLKVEVTGKANTADTKNFTLVANLIDAYEASPLFKNVVDRNFSKTASSDDEGANYDSSFQIEMTLETDPTIQ